MSEASPTSGLEVPRVVNLIQGVIGVAAFSGLRLRGMLITSLSGEPRLPIGVVDMAHSGPHRRERDVFRSGGLGFRSGELLYERHVRDDRFCAGQQDSSSREPTLALRALAAAAEELPYPIDALWYACSQGQTLTPAGNVVSRSSIHIQVAGTPEDHRLYGELEAATDGISSWREIMRGNQPLSGRYELTVGFGTLAEARDRLESQIAGAIPQPIPEMG